jgi:immune inhibitor A
MRKAIAGLSAATLVVATVSALGTTAAHAAAPTRSPGSAANVTQTADDLAGPLDTKRRELRKAAVQQVLKGRATVQRRGVSTVVKLAGAKGTRAQYVELSRQTIDRVFVVLTDFGNQRDPNYPDQDTDPNTPGPVRFDGPVHNQIPQPDRTVDNSTNWQPDYNQSYFQNIYFAKGGSGVESLATYYRKQSSGRYSVSGTVTDWVKVPYNEARYGRSNGYPCSAIVCANSQDLVRDGVNAWVADQQTNGRSLADITAELKTFDVWDRYDYDHDGNFNEPDGYLDHFQIVHAGGDQADGDPLQGEDAIWSHRSYVYQNLTGQAGPAGDLHGGTEIAGTGLWVGDYTMQPENGGRSVFFHEYGHDLGLPDEYDTAGGQGSPMEWWSLMSQSRAGAKGDQSIGNHAADLGAWDKLQLGWLDYAVGTSGDNKSYSLGPAEYNNSAGPQALVVRLPQSAVTTDYGAPYDGSNQWWSTQGDDLTTTMSRQVTLPAGSATLSFQARWNIEDCGPDACDYAYVEVDDGSGWKPIAGSITKPAEGNGIDGVQATWTPASFDLSAYAGKTVGVRVRYATDGAAQGTDPSTPAGIFLDAITLTAGGTTVFSDDAENPPNGWTLDGFRTVGASETVHYDRYYIAAWRTYVSYDTYLRWGPYNFGFGPAKPKLVEHFAYQRGLVVSYWNTQYSDNNVSVHPGEGEILTVDSHPQTLYRVDGLPWRARVQLYDAPFSRYNVDTITLHVAGVASPIAGRPGNPLFDDTSNYFDPIQKDHGVKVAGVGVKIRVLSQDGTTARVRLTSAAP